MEKVDIRDGERPPTPFQWWQWLWHPWYAKAWWIGAVAFWFGVLMVILFPSLLVSASDISPLVAVTFQPTVPIFYIIVRALWSRSTPWIAEDAVVEEHDGSLYDGGTEFGFHSSVAELANPLNLRSPLNPANQIYKFHHKK